MTKFFSFNPDVTPPIRRPPRNACDCHFHIYGDPAKYPLAPTARNTMHDATLEAMQKLHQALGIERGVICGTTANGTDYAMIMDALKLLGPNYKASAHHSVLDERSDSYLAQMDKAGIRGVRFNFLKMLGRMPDPAQVKHSIDRAREIGWYLKIQPDYHEPLESFAPFETIADTQIIIDHFARIPADQSKTGPVMDKVLELLKRGNFWVLLSNGYKQSREDYPWNDLLPAARTLIEAAPDRLIWASDWPHTFHEVPPPNDGDLYNAFHRWTSETERQRILVDNPAALFGFAR